MGALKTAFPDLPPPPKPPPVFALADPAKFKAELEAVGFKNVEVDYLPREIELPDFSSMWSMITVGAPPVRALFDRVGDEGKARVRDCLASSVEARFARGPLHATCTATVATARA